MIIDPEKDVPQKTEMVVQGYEIPRNTYSEHTEFLKYTNDFPIEREANKDVFISDNADFLRVINKYPGQANIDAIDELKADLLWKDMELALLWNTPGMKRRSERLSLKIDHLYARSRGRDGFGSKIQVTTRQEILAKEEKEREKQPFKFFRHKKREEMQVQGQPIQGQG